MFDLKGFRKDFKLSQVEISDTLGIAQSFISKMENGKDRVPDSFVKKLIDTYGIEDISVYEKSDYTETEFGENKKNSFSEYTDEEIQEYIAQEFKNYLLEMYESGRAFPEAAVGKLLKTRDDRIAELQNENFELRQRLETEHPGLN